MRGIELQVHPGEIFGLLGPNGAGKSTLVKILMTIIRPTRCLGKLLGQPVGHRATLARVGYLPEHMRLPDYLTGKQALDYLGGLAKVPRQARRKRAEELLELVGMSDWGDTPLKRYSKGMKQRIGVAQTLMHDPELIVLDEPTDGLDPVGRRDVRNVLVELQQQGKSVLINSHLLSELEMVCDRVSILAQGKVVKAGTIDSLTEHSRRYELTVAAPLPEDEALQTLIKSLKAEVELEDTVQRISVPNDSAGDIQPLVDALRSAGAEIHSMQPVRQSLEELFMQSIENDKPKPNSPTASH